MDAASPGASRRPWPSPVFARLGSPLLPLRGLTCRRGRLHLSLQTGELLDPLKGLCRDASPVGSRLAAAVSYRAAWSLPGPDFHRLVSVSLHKVTVSSISTSFLGCLVIWARRNRVNFSCVAGVGGARVHWLTWLHQSPVSPAGRPIAEALLGEHRARMLAEVIVSTNGGTLAVGACLPECHQWPADRIPGGAAPHLRKLKRNAIEPRPLRSHVLLPP